MYTARPVSRVSHGTSAEKRKLMKADWRYTDQPSTSVISEEPPVLVKNVKSGLQSKVPDHQVSDSHKQKQKLQGYCTCGQCIEGFISPRMKWLLSRYATIFEALLPRSLNIFEGIDIPHLADTSNLTFVDLDVYKDLDHLPASLRRLMQRNRGLMHGYCNIFGYIALCLEGDLVPSGHEIESRILNSHGEDSMDTKLFLMAGGQSKYAMRYLIDTVKDLSKVRNGSGLLEKGLSFLPRCLNDNSYSLVEDRLL